MRCRTTASTAVRGARAAASTGSAVAAAGGGPRSVMQQEPLGTAAPKVWQPHSYNEPPPVNVTDWSNYRREGYTGKGYSYYPNRERDPTDGPEPAATGDVFGRKGAWQETHDWDTERYSKDVIDAHMLLGSRPNDPLSRIKLKYLLACRKHHPEAGGDAGMFYRITLAYEQIMMDRGLECREGSIVYSDTVSPRSRVHRVLLTDGTTEMVKDALPLTPLLADAVFEAEVAAVERATAQAGRMSAADLGNEQPQAAEIGDVAAGGSQTDSMTAGGTAVPKAGAPHGDDRVVEAASAAPVTDQSAAAAEEDAADPTAPRSVVLTSEGEGDGQREHRVVIRPPETAVFEQQIHVAKLDDSTLQNLWNVAPEELTHDEEEAIAREMIERSLNSGAPLSESQLDFMMTHLIDRSESVAAEAVRAATDVMNNTDEKRTIRQEMAVLNVMVLSICALAFGLAFAYARYLKLKGAGDEHMSHLNAETMLPWWGNDVEYERQVKRLFIEEWRRARGVAQQQATFSKGLHQEERTEAEKHATDAGIFDVSPERLASLRDEAARKRAASRGENVPGDLARREEAFVQAMASVSGGAFSPKKSE